MDIGRIADLKELKKDLSTETDPQKIRLIKQAGSRIRKEQMDQTMRSARNDLINERIQGRQGNVKDIQDRLINGLETKGFGLNISDDRWKKIFGN